uniref:Uncharacterized protein n=1 Tax=Desertifilum tharense IPPAS B-1220 TaxID=1781255 RepID=A0A1E5QCP1_9CYAN|nr:hypothetical protein BH720_25160 [Desertifilum tharense IPPAS B-1220]
MWQPLSQSDALGIKAGDNGFCNIPDECCLILLKIAIFIRKIAIARSPSPAPTTVNLRSTSQSLAESY